MMWAAKGISLQIYIGPNKPTRAPEWLASALEEASVVHDSDQKEAEFSGFELSFRAGRSRVTEDELVSSPLLRPMSRVILVVFLDYQPTVLMDGVIIEQSYEPSEEPGHSLMKVKGQDIGYFLSLEERPLAYTGQSVRQTVETILGRPEYAAYGLIPRLDPTVPTSQPTTNGYVPTQRSSDFCHLRTLATRHHFAFYIVPGPGLEQNQAFFGPSLIKEGPAQPPLNVNLGPYTNAQNVKFRFDAAAPVVVKGKVQDSETHDPQDVQSQTPSSRLSKEVGVPKNRVVLPCRAGGLTAQEATEQAQQRTNESFGRTLLAEGDLDVLRYGALLSARRTVELRGVGERYSGPYYVKRVSHTIKVGQYQQRFVLQRPGQGAAR